MIIVSIGGLSLKDQSKKIGYRCIGGDGVRDSHVMGP